MKYIVVFPIKALVFFLNCLLHLFGYILIFIWELKLISFKQYLLNYWVPSYHSDHVGNETYPQMFKRWFNFKYH